MFMFPKFIQVGLYSRLGRGGGGGVNIVGTYIRDVNLVSYLGGAYFFWGANIGFYSIRIRG